MVLTASTISESNTASFARGVPLRTSERKSGDTGTPELEEAPEESLGPKGSALPSLESQNFDQNFGGEEPQLEKQDKPVARPVDARADDRKEPQKKSVQVPVTPEAEDSSFSSRILQENNLKADFAPTSSQMMKLSCDQSDLNTHLSLVSRAVPSRPNQPILANVLVTADAATQRLSLAAFDLTLGIQTTFAAEVESSGAITLPAKLLNDIVSRLPADSQVTLDETEAGSMVTLTANAGRYQVRGIAPDEFPELPLAQNGEAVQLPTEALIEGLKGTLFATSADETKQVLTGVHLKVQPEMLEFAATDGHRLSVMLTPSELSGADKPLEPLEPFDVTVPARALRDLERIVASRSSGEPIALYFDQGQTVFQWGDQYLTSRTLDGQYPNYNQLIPAVFERQITVDRRLFLGALERIAVLADQKSSVVKLTIEGESSRVTLSADAQDVGNGQESLPAQISGDSLEIAFNVRYLMDGLKAFNSSEIQIQLNSATSPVVLTPLGAMKMTYLVMPVQIRS